MSVVKVLSPLLSENNFKKMACFYLILLVYYNSLYKNVHSEKTVCNTYNGRLQLLDKKGWLKTRSSEYNLSSINQ